MTKKSLDEHERVKHVDVWDITFKFNPKRNHRCKFNIFF